MKIVSIDSYDFIGREDGQQHTSYSIFVALRPAAVAGSQIVQMSVPARVLDEAVKQLNCNEYKNLLNKDLNIYYNYDRSRKLFKCFAIFKA